MKLGRNLTIHKMRIIGSILLVICTLFISGCDMKDTEVQVNEQNGIIYVKQYEKEIIDLVNEIRKEKGLSELQYNEECYSLAKVKSEDIIENNYFDHKSPTNGYIDELAKSNGITFKTIGENLYKMKINNGDISLDRIEKNCNPKKIVDEWMSSPTHKENILLPKYDSIGVSVVYSNGKLIATQVFMKK